MQKGGAHSVASSQAEDRDIAEGEKGSKGNMETFPQESNGNEIYLKKDFSKTEGEKRMKKVLVITLVLVMAFASSAMAAVNLSGKFTATAEMESLKVFKDEYELMSSLEFTLSPAAEEDEAAWDFSGGLTLKDDNTITLGKYKLGLYDNYFNAYVWGNDYELTTKETYFSMISAAKKATGIRARLEVPVMDLATVTVDLAAPDNVRAFVNAEVEGFDVGLAYARKNWTDEDKVSNTIVAQAGTDVAEGIRVEVAGGVALGDDLGFGLGASVDADVTDELNLAGSVTHANENWVGDALVADNTVLEIGATYTEDMFRVTADVGYTIVKDDDNTNEISLGVRYRMSDAVTYANLFNRTGNAWAKNTAPAFGASVDFVDLGFDNVRVDVTSPVLEDMIWVHAYGSYLGDKDFKAGALGYILATDKLTVKPQVDYTYEDEESSTDVQLAADYKIGASDATLKFVGQRVFKAEPISLLKLSVEVPF